MIRSFLLELGLTESEVMVYLYLLTHGESLASVLAKRLGLKRSSAYTLLESLEQKEFVVRTTHNNVAHFNIVDPDELTYICQKRVASAKRLEQKAEQLQSELQRMRDRGEQLRETGNEGTISAIDIDGKIKYLEGVEAVRDMLEESLQERPEDMMIYCYGLNDYHTTLSPEDWKDYTNLRVKNGLHVHSIQPDTDAAIAYKGRDKKELRETKLVPHSEYATDTEINIIGDMIAMFSVQGTTPVAFKVYHKQLAAAMKGLFKLAWGKADELDSTRDATTLE